MLLLFAMAVLCLCVFGFVIYQYSKLIGGILFSIPFVLVLILGGWWILAANHYFISSTNLENETLGEFQLQEVITENKLKEVGAYEKRENGKGGFSFRFDDYFISTDEKLKVVSLSAGGDSQNKLSTGLTVGDNIEKVKLLFGDNNYTYWEMGLGQATVFIDRDNNYILTIWTKDEITVTDFWLSTY